MFDETFAPDLLAQEPASHEVSSRPRAEVLVSALALAACGGGGSTPAGGATAETPQSAPTPASPPSAPAISDAQAARFLAQAAMGSSRADIAEVQSLGFAGWIDAQFGKPRGTSIWDWLLSQGYNVNYTGGEAGFDPAMWRALIAEPDQLRQRVAMALLQTMVVGISGVTTGWGPFAAGAYVDLLFDNAFGNFRTLLGKVTTNVAMGSFLTFMKNVKANAATGAQPDENYARELMQLFTIGLRQLNPDGTEKSPPQDTYNQADVSGLARVFTGLIPENWDGTTPDRLRKPMILAANLHENGASSFLGVTVPAGTDGLAAINIALDTIFAHPNVPPFFARQMIQRMVTSNPSPAYVGRVSAVFANNGNGERGDIKATVRAILLDDEARTPSSDPNAGKLREPVMRVTGWARAFGATSPSNAWPVGNTSSQINRLGESMGRSPSVFNWWRPGYSPPVTSISAAGKVAPEFQVTNEVSNIAYVNFMQLLIQGGMGDFKADYSAITVKAGDSGALVDEINIILAAGQLSSAAIATIRGAVDSIPPSDAVNRVNTAVLLTMASPDFLALR